jgi:hypothetical protein
MRLSTHACDAWRVAVRERGARTLLVVIFALMVLAAVAIAYRTYLSFANEIG